jgi:hypothetical protein
METFPKDIPQLSSLSDRQPSSKTACRKDSLLTVERVNHGPPRNPPFPEPQASPDRGRNYTVTLEIVFAARGDPTSPPLPENALCEAGYVGRAARPPRSGAFQQRRYTGHGLGTISEVEPWNLARGGASSSMSRIFGGAVRFISTLLGRFDSPLYAGRNFARFA